VSTTNVNNPGSRYHPIINSINSATVRILSV
jgi:hypothetical protein